MLNFYAKQHILYYNSLQTFDHKNQISEINVDKIWFDKRICVIRRIRNTSPKNNNK